MFAKQLPEASADLDVLVAECRTDKQADPALLADAREALANAQYYMTWLMRLEGFPRDEWEPEIEGARQTYRLLAEQAEPTGDRSAKQRKEDLESAIRLARMEPGELQGLPIPKQCQGCKSGQCKKPGRRPSNSKKPAEGRPRRQLRPPARRLGLVTPDVARREGRSLDPSPAPPRPTNLPSRAPDTSPCTTADGSPPSSS